MMSVFLKKEQRLKSRIFLRQSVRNLSETQRRFWMRYLNHSYIYFHDLNFYIHLVQYTRPPIFPTSSSTSPSHSHFQDSVPAISCNIQSPTPSVHRSYTLQPGVIHILRFRVHLHIHFENLNVFLDFIFSEQLIAKSIDFSFIKIEFVR